eukprot:TRINITY_DN2245_c0_g1_i2.p1 TRINITY_DN2245_c0_g1~~TRINITY_DN2245_c0_g1_i2.p1  ORF type:complete len:257 (+),score=44.46 TRINITY_DN2245_c0_g1_i2:315-1085(+)
MKLIPDLANLAHLNFLLSNIDDVATQSKLFGSLEAYSCKRAGSDKKLGKTLEHQYEAETSPTNLHKSPEMGAKDEAPFGSLERAASRKVLIDLISLLNAAYPDYDFSSARPQEFTREANLQLLQNSVDNTLSQAIEMYNEEMKDMLWQSIDEVVSLADCEIYSYVPDADGGDPFSEEGCIWSFNYFFYNRKLKKVVFFTCRSLSKSAPPPKIVGLPAAQRESYAEDGYSSDEFVGEFPENDDSYSSDSADDGGYWL